MLYIQRFWLESPHRDQCLFTASDVFRRYAVKAVNLQLSRLPPLRPRLMPRSHFPAWLRDDNKRVLDRISSTIGQEEIRRVDGSMLSVAL